MVFLLNTNELPLCHVFVEMDGSTKSSDAFAGPIGKKLDSNVSQWPVVAFKSIPNPHFPMLPNDVLEDLSTVQYYGYKICRSVICGEVDDDFRLHNIGPYSSFKVADSSKQNSSVYTQQMKIHQKT